MPGWTSVTWGLHGDDGGLFHVVDDGHYHTMSYNENRTFGTTETINTVGCGINPLEGTAYFTRNGELLGKSTWAIACCILSQREP